MIAAFLALMAIWPGSARADGPTLPTATSYQARLTHVPPGIQAKVEDGYLGLWMRAPANETVIVKDFEGAPWVRFDRAGVQANTNSPEYYLSQTPIPAVPPGRLTRSTRPHWVTVTSGHSYMWREGRMHALTAVALTPGQRYVGRWSIALTIDHHAARLEGGLWHLDAPSAVWFWPIIVILACALAAFRVRSPRLDESLTRWLTFALLVMLALAMGGRYLHGRPSPTAVDLTLLIAILAAISFAATRLLSRRSGLPLMFATVVAGLWAGLSLVTVLTHGYVLLAIPPLAARCITVGLLGGSLSLVLFGMRALNRVASEPAVDTPADP